MPSHLVAFGFLISVVSSVAAPNAAECSHNSWHASHRCHRQVHRDRSFSYTSVDRYQGRDFLNDSLWTYFTATDPTHGQVKYVSRDEAQKKGLAYVNDKGTAVLRVDAWTDLPLNAPRNSVRIASTKTINSNSLVIADFQHMPYGCSVWPSFWTVGHNWPNDGEIDIVEGVNNKQMNQYTFHTAMNQPCSIPKVSGTPAFTGTVMNTDCKSSQTGNTGCSTLDSSNTSFGQGFADAGGGVFALLWDGEGIKIWHFARQSIPADVHTDNPKPYNWSLPNAFLSADDCTVDSFFKSQRLIIDTTLCGPGWAGSDYVNSGCPGTCAEQIQNGSNHLNAAWRINSITIYS